MNKSKMQIKEMSANRIGHIQMSKVRTLQCESSQQEERERPNEKTEQSLNLNVKYSTVMKY